MTYLGRGTRDTVVPYGLGQSAESSSCMLKIRPSRERFGRIGVRQIEFPSAVEANPVGAVFNREHTAEVAVAASTNELEHTQKHTFTNPALAGAVRNFHWHRATRAENGYWLELMQLSSLRLRSKC